jgi:hypothetical protein
LPAIIGNPLPQAKNAVYATTGKDGFILDVIGTRSANSAKFRVTVEHLRQYFSELRRES